MALVDNSHFKTFEITLNFQIDWLTLLVLFPCNIKTKKKELLHWKFLQTLFPVSEKPLYKSCLYNKILLRIKWGFTQTWYFWHNAVTPALTITKCEYPKWAKPFLLQNLSLNLIFARKIEWNCLFLQLELFSVNAYNLTHLLTMFLSQRANKLTGFWTTGTLA